MLAGIVLFNPERNRLRENINAILPQVQKLILVDNGSTNVGEILTEYEKNSKIQIIQLGSNLGIAVAQNQICAFAETELFEWAITLDQDSVVPNNLVAEYKNVIEAFDDNVGMICPKIIDRNFGEITYGKIHEGVEEVPQCIASASAIRISAWKKVGGFYEPLFIDAVDFDMCWSLREHGYKILRINDVKLLHEVGHSKVVQFAGKERLILNHSPLRYYYIMRNSFLVGRRHCRLLRNLKADIRLVYQINRYETNRLKKDIMLWKGFWHGLFGKSGKYGT